jgi:uncharacterized protein involved in exopolysaccharide biosynthesis
MQAHQSVARLVEAPPEIEPVAASYLEEQPRPQSESDGSEWLWLLWERRKFLWRVAVWGLVLSTAIAFVIPPRYESTTRLMPPDNQSGSGLAMLAAMAGKGSSGLGSIAGDLLGMKNSSAIFVDILHSRTVEDRIIDRFDLRKIYRDRYWEDARRQLAEKTGINEDRKSGIITITVTDGDPRRASAIASAYVEELDRLVSQVSTSSARRERLFIEQRMASVKQDLTDAEKQFSQFASKNAALDIKEQTKAMVESAALLQGQLIAAQSEMQGLQQIYTGNNVRVRSLQARIQELQRQLDKMGGANPAVVADATQSGQLYPSIRQLPLLGVEWADLYRRMKIQETVFELLNQQYELARIQEAKEIPVVQVIDPANIPEKKSFPPRAVVMLSLTLLCLVGGAAWLLGAARWEKIDLEDSRKALAETVFRSVYGKVRAVASRLGVNGNRPSFLRRSRGGPS